MDLAPASLLKVHNKIKFCHHGGSRLDSDSSSVLLVRFPDHRLLRVLSRSLLFAMMLLSLPCIGCLWRGFVSEPPSTYAQDQHEDIDAKLLDFIFQDLFNEGLVKKGHTALVLAPRADLVPPNSPFFHTKELNLVMASYLEKQVSTPGDLFDVVFIFAPQNGVSVDHLVKLGGLLVYQSDGFSALKEPNYSVVYLRQYDSTVVAMRKTSMAKSHHQGESTTTRKLFGMMNKKAALEGLENVFLEPPRRAMQGSRKTLQKFRYLPDLMHDNLEEYPRLVFVEVSLEEEDKGAATRWFKESYPRRNKRFELYEEGHDASNWLINNLREEDFVVMKAEAEAVEEMMETKSLALVDELFLECHSQWQSKRSKKKTRAYWECLNLYGRLRDEGIAVHQWWG